MRVLKNLLENNRKWAEKVKKLDPGFFLSLSKKQNPEYLWIGCSDSRVPANEIVNMPPGTMFVHRNIANIVNEDDLNCRSVIQYAVEVLKVKHIIICGHYGCGGIQAVIDGSGYGAIDVWLQNVNELYHKHKTAMGALQEKDKINLLCELNVTGQVANICRMTIVQSAWDKGQKLAVHGWIYNLEDGLLKDLNVCVANKEEMSKMQGIEGRR